MDALAKVGVRRRELVVELEEIDSAIDKNLTRTYLEGWTWEELREASSLSQGPLATRLRKLGLTKPGAERKTRMTGRRSGNREAASVPEPAAPVTAGSPARVRADTRDERDVGRFRGMLSWIPTSPPCE